MESEKVIGWMSGGITSAVTCKLCLDIYGEKNVEFIFIDTHNEDDDTYRFLKECEEWMQKPIKTITSDEFSSVQDVWRKHLSLNVAHGAVCSSILKRRVREKWQKKNSFKHLDLMSLK